MKMESGLLESIKVMEASIAELERVQNSLYSKWIDRMNSDTKEIIKRLKNISEIQRVSTVIFTSYGIVFSNYGFGDNNYRNSEDYYTDWGLFIAANIVKLHGVYSNWLAIMSEVNSRIDANIELAYSKTAQYHDNLNKRIVEWQKTDKNIEGSRQI